MATRSILPPQAAFHHAVLGHLAQRPDGDRRGNVYEAVADLLRLDESQRSERLANMPHLRYRHRTGWSLGVLNKHGYVDSPMPEVWRITDRGRDLLACHPDGFAEKTVAQLTRESGDGTGPNDVAASAGYEVTESVAQQTPDERIIDALQEMHHTVAQELLDRIAQAPPAFFEGLVPRQS
jgi:restriction system protein